jgi:hypothetical protein
VLRSDLAVEDGAAADLEQPLPPLVRPAAALLHLQVAARSRPTPRKSTAELIDQSNREGDFAILSTAKTKIALSRFKGVKGFNGRFE